MTHLLTKFSSRILFLAVAVLLFSDAGFSTAIAQEAQWIWAPQHRKNAVPQGACHFRKEFSVKAPERGQVLIAADDRYELYVNGTRVAYGESTQRLNRHDISNKLRSGRNVIAIKVTNLSGSTAALVARVQVKGRGGWSNYSTNKSWKTNIQPLPLWNMQIYNDQNWASAQSFGPLGSTAPWDREKTVPADEPQRHTRFRIANEFRVQKLIDDEDTGSLIAMTFNEFGQILASQEDGPLIIITDSDRDGVPDKVAEYCDEVKSCQGILALNGEAFVTADGPDGSALYRLVDEDRNGKIESVSTLLEFTGEPGEHGPHGLVLGPDGMIYITIGNHSKPEVEFEESSPHRNYYEGDLVPRYEDPGGHATNVKVPGGTIIRTDLTGKKVELVAGGLRNAYDLAFNSHGDLFTHDSDMESDVGTTWYRPTQLFQVLPGGEYGWRSGWAKWPSYFHDNLPGIVDTGRGSPTGAVVYDHIMFPKRFHGALFLGDWSEGRIIAVRMKREGGKYKTEAEIFVEGQPLNVTDLSVGPDGALYFITGGRGTGGGVYRISWRGKVPKHITELGEGITRVIRHPQLQSAYARQKIAGLKIELADEWNKSLVGVAITAANPSYYRTRALDVLQLFGPLPSTDLLVGLAKDKNEEVRAKAAELMGLHPDDRTQKSLVALLSDSDSIVRRKACEALVRANQVAPVDDVFKLLAADDRYEVWSARRLLERIPPEQWYNSVITTEKHRRFVQGATAMLIANPSNDTAMQVLRRISELMEEFVSDRDFVDMLRVAQLAYHRGEVAPDGAPELRIQLAEEFPSGNSLMNRELTRLLAYLQTNEITDRFVAYLKSKDVPDVDKLHVAMQVRYIKEGWTSEQRLDLLRFFAKAIDWEGGGSFEHYVINVSRDIAKGLNEADAMLVIANGAQWPHAALGALYKLPAELDEQTRRFLKEVDRQLADRNDAAARQLKVGLVAVFARSADDESIEYMRDIWQRDPERRETVAMGLAQKPDGENWDYLLRSLPVVDDKIADIVLGKLATVNVRPEEPEYYRYVIIKGLREGGSKPALALLQHWTGQQLGNPEDEPEVIMESWQEWYKDQFPDAPSAELPKTSVESKWEYDELLEYLSGTEGSKGDPENGAKMFEKAQCIKCHRFQKQGESMGPDLTNLSKRFTRKEILQSILFPSHVVSSQYASKTVITLDGRQHTGIVAPGADGEINILGVDGKKKTIAKDEIDETVPSKVSAMPEGLLNELSQEDIADLFSYLGVAPPAKLARRNKDTERR